MRRISDINKIPPGELTRGDVFRVLNHLILEERRRIRTMRTFTAAHAGQLRKKIERLDRVREWLINDPAFVWEKERLALNPQADLHPEGRAPP